MCRPTHLGYHVWLPLAGSEAEALDAAAKALGVLLTPPASTSASGELRGIRLCIGAPSGPDLERALADVAAIMERIRTGPREWPSR